ncbi:MAG: hypothetical protein POELPBGB_02061 [Bacteroidia bacterium]|nr:hypothetical protein [Bacteroidia bacterium]
MKSKLLNFLLIITSLFGYLEWGTDSHSFLFMVEAEIFSKLFSDPLSVLHPFTVVPFAGQVILLITLLQNPPNKVLTYIGMGCLALLLVLVFAIGVLSLNYKIFFSAVPFLVVAVVAVRHYRSKPDTLR